MRDSKGRPDLMVTTIEAIDTRKVLPPHHVDQSPEQKAIADFLFCDDPETMLQTLEDWFLNYMVHNAGDCDKEERTRHTNHYQWIKQLIVACQKIEQTEGGRS